jgi:carbonic anhydrase
MILNQRLRSQLVFFATALGCFAYSQVWAADVQPKSIDASSSHNLLVQGNKRFVRGQLRKDGESSLDRKRLAQGQHPHSVVLSCSDSRVPPELVFDQKLGDLFTVRTAGETLSPQVIGSIEFAIENLGSRLIVVMGHTQCGAVKAAVQTLDGRSAGSANLDQVVSDIHPRIRSLVSASSPASKDFSNEGWANAQGVAQSLVERSPIIANALKSGRIKIETALYDLETGVVAFKR